MRFWLSIAAAIQGIAIALGLAMAGRIRRSLAFVRQAVAVRLPRSWLSSLRKVRDALKSPAHERPNRLFLRPAASLLCACLVFVAGLLALAIDSKSWKTLTRTSYDWSSGLSRVRNYTAEELGTVIIYVDSSPKMELGKVSSAPLDRALPTRIVARLQEEEARTVVMDIVFNGPGPRYQVDEELAAAIHGNGRVILAQDLSGGNDALGKKTLDPLYPPFQRAAAATGVALLHPDSDLVVRRHAHSFEDIKGAPPSLSWLAAQSVLKRPLPASQQKSDRWVRYYGPPGTLPHLSYKEALEKPAHYFRNKTVFIGVPANTALVDKTDGFRTPFPGKAASGQALMPIAEVHATEFLNLVRRDWLERPSLGIEILILAATAFLFCFGLFRFPPLAATLLTVVGGLVFLFLTQKLFGACHIWFVWLVPVGVEIPLALFFSIICHSLEWVSQHREMQEHRRRAELRIREQAALLDKAQDAIIVHDLDWRAKYWNRSAETLYGWPSEEVLGKDLRFEILKADKPEFLDAFEETLAKGEWSGELEQTTKQGDELIIQSRWTLVRDEEGQPKSIFVINTDITDQKRLEAQFLRTQRVESIGNLASGIAHDLNNVLSPVLMGVQLLKPKIGDDITRRMLATIEGSVKRGADMIRQLLVFGRGQQGKRTLVSPKQLFEEMRKIVADTFPKNIEFHIEADETDPVLGDSTQIHQILLNLCVNARDAMPAGGRIIISARNVSVSRAEASRFADAKAGDYVLLTVADNGTGISPKLMDRIFEPFFTTKEFGKGTGLGLSTVMTIVRGHGGFLDLRSRVGKGTTFDVYLPRGKAAETRETVERPRTLGGKGETVMVVDDDCGVRELTGELLNFYGYKVLTAENGAQAVALYAEHKDVIKIVVMDMMMPVMDGISAIKALRKQEPQLRIVATSGVPQGDNLKDIPGGFEIPFLSKPCPPEKLLEQLNRLLQSNGARAAA